MLMDALSTYKVYLALKNHFTSDTYDYFKYRTVKLNSGTFERRKDKYFFVKLGRNRGNYLEDFLVANFVINPKVWVGELVSDQCDSIYKSWQKKQQSMSYIFENEIQFMEGISEKAFNDLLKVNSGEHPEIIRMYLQNDISLETLIILNEVLTFLPRYDKILSDPLYNEVSRLCKKYRPFMDINTSKCRTIVKSVMGL